MSKMVGKTAAPSADEILTSETNSFAEANEEFFSLSISDTFAKVHSGSNGISSDEAGKRLAQSGKNVLAVQKRKNAFLQFLGQFKDILIVVLIISAIASVIIGAVEHSSSEFIDAGFIFGVVLLNAIIGFVQQRKSEKAMQALKNMTKPFCKVQRGKRSFRVKTEDVVVGDLVLLEAGDIVPADLRLVESCSLKIEESTLTGESVPVEKDAAAILPQNTALAERSNMAFMGSVVTYGRGSGVVVATGAKTQMGQIAKDLSEIDDTITPLTKRLKATSVVLTIAVLVVCAVIFIVQVATGGSAFAAFSMAIAIAVCTIPEGLPACNTVTLSMGVKRMSDQRAIVKTLPAVETLGSTEVICSDKTGTLTLNKMTVQKVFFLAEECEKINAIKIEPSPDNTLEKLNEEFEFKSRGHGELLRCMLLCNDTKVRLEDDKLESIGDPTEVALVQYGYRFGLDKQLFDGRFVRVGEVPFDSNRKMMTTFNTVRGKTNAYCKGAVDSVLVCCNRILDNGRIRRITAADKERILQENAAFAAVALRNLAFAYKIMDKPARPTAENTEFDFCFLGLVGMMDPPREEVKDAIKTCKTAGIATIMITGDHKDTAFAIANELGICTNPNNVITGKELDQISDKDFSKLVQKYQVYARVSPQHKVRIVRALKENNKIVAMTGDGVNDAPSIKAADIGVGMGITGTDVTKEAADMILTDDNFATIVGAVKEGRRVYSTILKIFMFLLGTSIAELAVMTVVTLVFRDGNFFNPVLLLWINFVSDTFVGLALGFEKAEKNIMRRKPVKNSGNLFRGNVGFNIFSSALFVFACTISLYCVCRFVWGLSPQSVTAICFVQLSLSEIFHAFNLKSQKQSLFAENPFDNRWLNWAVLASALLTILVVVLPIEPLQNAFGVCNLVWWQWLLAIGVAFAIIPYFEIVKLCVRIFEKIKLKKGKKTTK